MINYNGDLKFEENVSISVHNRALKYGDSVFETLKANQNKIYFFEDHYFRLMASMRMMRMEIPMDFTLEFLQNEIFKTIAQQPESDFYRIRLTIFRKDGGLYTPKTNSIDYLIEVSPLSISEKSSYVIDLYKDFYNYSGLLSTVKTNNRMVNTLASVFAKENDFDNCVLLNERKGVVEVTNGNIFIIKDNIIKTPALTEGCIKGIVRKKIIEIISKNENYSIEETNISPFELQKADEIFITNAIIGVQPVTKYRKKEYKVKISLKLKQSLQVLALTSS